MELTQFIIRKLTAKPLSGLQQKSQTESIVKQIINAKVSSQERLKHENRKGNYECIRMYVDFQFLDYAIDIKN